MYLVDVANGDGWKEDVGEGRRHGVDCCDDCGLVELRGLLEHKAACDDDGCDENDKGIFSASSPSSSGSIVSQNSWGSLSLLLRAIRPF